MSAKYGFETERLTIGGSPVPNPTTLFRQGNIEHFHHVSDVMECQSLQVSLVDLFDVFFIFPTHNNLLYAGTFGGQYFFLDASHRQYFTTERDLTCHGQVRPNGDFAEERNKRSEHGDSCRGTIFGDGTFG